MVGWHRQCTSARPSPSRGGYTIDDWPTPDPDANPTTLDALGLGRVLYIIGSISPTVEGLRITGGDATGLGDRGGGVYVSAAAATISNCVVYSNTASTTSSGWGGGLYLSGSDDAVLSGNTVQGNTVQGNTASTGSTGSGGGLSLWQSTATLSGNTIISNTATLNALASGYGGGVRVRQRTPSP